LPQGTTTTWFPNSTTAGYLHTGVTLHPCSSVSSNTTYDSCLFSKGLDLTAGQTGVTITRSKIIGTVHGNYQPAPNLTMTDVEIDSSADASTCATWGLDHYVYTRVDSHGSGCFCGVGWTITDSYCHMLNWGTAGQHMEDVQTTGSGATLKHSNIIADPGTGPGGGNGAWSGVAVMYSHPTFWSPLSNVTWDHNRFELRSPASSWHCFYFGNSCSQPMKPTGVKFTNNVIAGHASDPTGDVPGCGGGDGKQIGWHNDGGATEIWSGNSYEDGTPIPEP